MMQKTDAVQLTDQAETPEVSVEWESGVEGGAELQSALADLAGSFRVGGFKCAHEECGLVHGHATDKHRAGDSFDMSDSEAASMEANPNCHCGLNELAKRGVDEAPTPSQANSKAPIPDSMSRHLDASL
jgi:hypothetical protein